MRLKTPEWLVDAPGSIFDGVPESDVQELVRRVDRRRFTAGSVVVSVGESQDVIYLTKAGEAEIVFADRYGRERVVGRLEPGDSFGEMSLLTGEPAAATIRVTAELEVVMVGKEDVERLASRFPVVYRNLAEILSERLASTMRIAAQRASGRVTFLRDRGAPPLLAHALASSIAWHTRTRTLLLALGDNFPEELHSLAAGENVLETAGSRRDPGLDLALAPAEGPFSADCLAETTHELAERYDHVLVLTAEEYPLPEGRTFDLTGWEAPAQLQGSAPAELTVRAGTGPNPRGRGPRAGVLDVPQLQAADEAALRDGLLPSRTPAGRALGWLARDLSGLTVGLALGGGSLRGYAHFGVLAVLERLGIEPDYLAGTSIGSAVATGSALGFSAQEGAAIFDRGAKGVFRPALPIYALLSGGGVRRFVQSMTGQRRIEDLDVPLGIVTADLLSRREVVLRRGSLWQAVVASMAIPGIYPAQRVGPWVLVDGGIVNPVPTSVCTAMGAGVVIGVSLGRRPAEPIVDAEAVRSEERPPGAISVLLSSIDIMQSEVVGDQGKAPSITIVPEMQPLPRGALRNFTAGRRYFADGERAAEEALPRLAAALPWLRSADAVSARV